MYNIRHLRPFILYATSGVFSTILELALLYVLLNVDHMPYYFSVPLAFIVTTTVHYFACRVFIFDPSERKISTEYAYFVLILTSGAVLTTTLVALFVELFALNVYIARIIAGTFTMLWDYYLNVRFNFRMYWH